MAQQMMIRVYTPAGTREYVLESFGRSVVYFGRGAVHGKDNMSPANDIAMDNTFRTVSRSALEFVNKNGTWFVRNTSPAVVLCNGQPVGELPLYSGARIQVSVEQNGVAACELECVACEVPVQQPVVPQPVVYDNDDKEGTMRQQGAPMPKPASQSQGGADEPIMISLLEKPQYVIGRIAGCDVVLSHPQVSRQHAVIRRENNQLVLHDNHSTNGVMVNGRQLTQPHAIANGDRISIASFTLTFQNGYLYCKEHKGGVSLEAVDVCKAVRDGNKKGKATKNITDHVSLKIEPGEFVAIIGGSGAGKSTVMNCLSGMTDFTSGEVLVGGEPLSVNSTTLRSIIGYVPQSDIVYDDLTLERMLMYSAKLRMPPDTTEDDISKKIDETLAIVELSEHRKTLIKKLSGGQRKRASMAVELLASPSLFFLDEPFSGLDPGTEKKLMLMLKKLSMTGKTVIMVTHSVQNIELTDRLICMGRGGKLCYSGDPNKALAFFGVGSFTDVYDLLDNKSTELSQRFYQTQTNNGAPSAPSTPIKGNSINSKGAGMRQFLVLTKRYAELAWNRRGRLILLMLMPVVLSLFVCIAFGMDGGIKLGLYSFFKDAFGWEISSLLEYTSFPYVEGMATESMLMTFACAAFWIGIFNSIQEISKESNIYHREQFTGVNPMPYLGSKIVINSVLCLVQALVMTTILVIASNYKVSYTGDTEGELVKVVKLVSEGQIFGSVWLELFVTTFLTMISAMLLGLVVSAAVSNDMALVMCPICLLPQILFSGVVSTLKGATEIISHIITCRWSVLGYCFSVDINGLVEGHEMGDKLMYYGESSFYPAFKLTDYMAYSTSNTTEDAGELANKIFYKASSGVATYNPDATHIFGLDAVPASWVWLLILTVGCFLIAWGLLAWNSSRTAALQSVNGKGRGKRRR